MSVYEVGDRVWCAVFPGEWEVVAVSSHGAVIRQLVDGVPMGYGYTFADAYLTPVEEEA